MVNITEKEYKCAYKEVTMIIDYLEESIKELIPKEKIEFYKNHMDDNYDFEIDYDKTINEQNILYPTKCILANLFKNYIADENDKKLIIKKEKLDLLDSEMEKREKYNSNEIFNKKIEKVNLKTEDIYTNIIVSEKKKSFFEIIKNKIINFLNNFHN